MEQQTPIPMFSFLIFFFRQMLNFCLPLTISVYEKRKCNHREKLSCFKSKHVVFSDQSKMKATIKENSFNKYQETTREIYVNQEMEIWVCTSNGMDHFSLVRPEYSGPALKVVHFDHSGHFSWLDHLTKYYCCPQYSSLVSCLQEQ